jgi:uncharacterized membrane protein
MSSRGHSISITINAPPHIVWNILRDVESWPKWTPTMSSVAFASQKGFEIGAPVLIQQPGLPLSTWTITAHNDGHSFTWRTTSPGVTVDAHHVVLDQAGTTIVEFSITMFGPLAAIVWAVSRKKIRGFIAQEIESLRMVAEET